jgi:hypothetical protein
MPLLLPAAAVPHSLPLGLPQHASCLTLTKSPTRQLRSVQLGSMVTNLPTLTLAEMPAGDVLYLNKDTIK